jgi:hypothetical protein
MLRNGKLASPGPEVFLALGRINRWLAVEAPEGRLEPGRAEALLAHAPVLQDQSLRGTSSWANTWHHRDHLSKRTAVPAAQPPIPITGRPVVSSSPASTAPFS